MTRCVRQLLLVLSALVDGLCSVLEEIERQSLELLGKGTAARFMDKAGDSGMVAGLMNDFERPLPTIK